MSTGAGHYWVEVGLGLGSNLGERLNNLNCARDAILSLEGVRHNGSSAVFETEPVGVRPEHADKAFLNAVVIICTWRSPQELIAELQQIEHVLGRERDPRDRYGPRTLDIDVLYFGDLHTDAAELTLPHPQCARRRFVCQPLASLRPDLILPGMDRSIRALLDDLPAEPTVTEYGTQWRPIAYEDCQCRLPARG